MIETTVTRICDFYENSDSVITASDECILLSVASSLNADYMTH